MGSETIYQTAVACDDGVSSFDKGIGMRAILQEVGLSIIRGVPHYRDAVRSDVVCVQSGDRETGYCEVDRVAP